MITYKINGKRATRRQWRAKKGVGLNLHSGEVPMGTVAYSEDKPLVSESLGRLPSQVKEYREELRKAKITGVRVLDNGAVEITSKRGRNELLAYHNKHDLDGGYGDR